MWTHIDAVCERTIIHCEIVWIRYSVWNSIIILKMLHRYTTAQFIIWTHILNVNNIHNKYTTKNMEKLYTIEITKK